MEEQLLTYITEANSWLTTQDRINKQLNKKTHALYPSLTAASEPTRSDRFDPVSKLIYEAVTTSESYHRIKALPQPDLEQLEDIEKKLEGISSALSQAHTDTLFTIAVEEHSVIQAHAKIGRGNAQ